MLRATIWLSVLAWAASEVLRRTGPADRRAVRAAYSAGALLLAIHIVIAFQTTHGWSHAAAYAETARRTALMTGVASGAGLYLNYLFAAFWMADATWWWIRPAGRATRSRGIDLAGFGFFVFMMVNGAVIFAAGPMRLAGAAAVAAAIAARVWVPQRALVRNRA